MIDTVYRLMCDICQSEESQNFYTLKDIINYKKEKGWMCKVTTSSFVDICPECAVTQVDRLLAIKF